MVSYRNTAVKSTKTFQASSVSKAVLLGFVHWQITQKENDPLFFPVL